MSLTCLAPTFVTFGGFELPNVKERPRITLSADPARRVFAVSADVLT